MDDETKDLLREIRDEVWKTNERIDEVKAWAQAEVEKEKKESERYSEAFYDSQKVLPKKDLWGLAIIAVMIGGYFIFSEFIK